MELVNGMEDYGSAPGGESIYKDSKGYYIVQWNPKTSQEFRKYLSKSWKPDPNRTRVVLKCKSKNKKCKWTLIKPSNTAKPGKRNKTKKNK
jgi:hypothetical protein